jgi:O-antigen/teichoic acid export membrane protein
MTPTPGAPEAKTGSPGTGMTSGRATPLGRSRRAILTTVDQGMFSVSNFAVGVAIAHISGIVGLGSYSLAYAVYLVFLALHRALITDPMAIENDMRHTEAPRHLAAGLASELTLGIVAAVLIGLLGGVLILCDQHTFGICILALAPWLPVLLAQDYWRWIGFMQARPGKALTNDIVFDCVQAVVFIGLVVAGIRSPVVAIGAWGVGAAAGAVFGLRQFSVGITLRGGWTKLRRHWPISRWLSANGVIAWGSSQSYAVLVAAILGPVGVGGLRAAQTLVIGVALVLLQSGSSLGLPEASRGLAERGWAGLRNVTRFITTAAVVAVGLVAVVVAFEGAAILRFFYGPGFGRYATAATLTALGTVLSALALGSILTLKATRQSRVLFVLGTVQMTVTAIAIAALASIWGVTGAALGIGIGSALSTAGLLVAQHRTFRTAPSVFAVGAGSAGAQSDAAHVEEPPTGAESAGPAGHVLRAVGQVEA